MKSRLTRMLASALLLAATLVVGLTPGAAYADSCGDTADQWVPALVGSVWSGTAGSSSITAVMVTTDHAAATLVDTLPVVGAWGYVDDFRWTGATEGFSYFFEVSATACSGGKVTDATGSGHDALFNAFAVTITRTL
jgi:hypothetical protein